MKDRAGGGDRPARRIVSVRTLAKRTSPSNVRRVLACWPKRCPENRELYAFDRTSREFRELVASVRRHGILEPIVTTEDGIVISGHRRLEAAKVAGVWEVPVTIVPLQYEGGDREEVLRLLREYNRQRVKTPATLVREAALDAADNAEAAYERMKARRRERIGTSLNSEDAGVEVEAPRRWRAAISRRKRPFLKAVQRVIDRRRPYWPLSVRAVHYALLADPPLRNADDPGSTYRNDRRSYQDLSGLLTRARIVGFVPWAAIADETRQHLRLRCYATVWQFVRGEVEQLFAGYYRDLQADQPAHIELVIEKNTLLPIVRDAAFERAVPLTSGRGYSSIDAMHKLATRIRDSGKDGIVLVVADHDPDGEEIPRAILRALRDDFWLHNVEVRKIALTGEQVAELDLPPSMEARRSSSRYRRFAQQFGTDAYEVEALEPETLESIVADALDAVLDQDALEWAREAEQADAAVLDRLRQAAARAIEEETKRLTNQNNDD